MNLRHSISFPKYWPVAVQCASRCWVQFKYWVRTVRPFQSQEQKNPSIYPTHVPFACLFQTVSSRSTFISSQHKQTNSHWTTSTMTVAPTHAPPIVKRVLKTSFQRFKRGWHFFWPFLETMNEWKENNSWQFSVRMECWVVEFRVQQQQYAGMVYHWSQKQYPHNTLQDICRCDSYRNSSSSCFRNFCLQLSQLVHCNLKISQRRWVLKELSQKFPST